MSSSPAELQAQILIQADRDIVEARMRGRELSLALGFSPALATLVATAISELARNILLYAQRGEVCVSPLERGSTRGVLVVARDQGRGIPDVRRALEDGYSTGGRLGLGLPGVRRLMDELEIDSSVGGGTVVRVKKWLP